MACNFRDNSAFKRTFREKNSVAQKLKLFETQILNRKCLGLNLYRHHKLK